MSHSARRPFNTLLQRLGDTDYELLSPSLNHGESVQGETLYHPGDPIEFVYFPCGRTLVSVAIAANEDRDVDTVLVGREGAIGGIIGDGFLPAYSRIVVRVEGPLAKLPVRKLNDAKHRSDELRRLFERYSDYFVAQQGQSTACNAAHSVEHRTAKWICQIVEYTGDEHLTLTHEELAGLLELGRSYLTRVLQGLKIDGLLDTTRGGILVRDLTGLRNRSCRCNQWLKKQYTEVLS